MIYLDTSTLAALYWPESTSKRVQDAVASSESVAISALSDVELTSAISRRLRMRQIAREDAVRVVTTFLSHLSEGAYARIALSPDHFTRARDLIVRFDTPLRTLDALHLSAAILSERRLVTADRQLANSAQTLGCDAQLIPG